MRILSNSYNVSFKRALQESEVRDYSATLRDAKKLAGQTGKSILIVHDACLPQSPEINTGVGNLASRDSLDFFRTMKTYLGINTVEVLPQGPVKPSRKGFYGAYSSSALPLSNHIIDPELLTEKEFGYLVSKEDVAEVVRQNAIPDRASRANYPNVVDDNSPFDNMLKKAFEKFNTLDEKNALKQKFRTFIAENNDWLEPIARADESVDADFFKFKQFLATEHLKIAKQNLNKLGLKLCVDCEIGFSKQEVLAFPEAFKKDTYIGCPSWHLPALNYDTILEPNSASYKLLKRKVQLAAQRGDTIRFDVAWSYVTPKLTTKDGDSYKKEMGDSLISQIEGWVREIKGEDFDVRNLIHEFEAGPSDFRAMVSDTELIEPLKGRTKVYSATHLSETWGSNDAFINYRGWSPDEFVIGVGNHDPQPLRQLANGVHDPLPNDLYAVYKTKQIAPLSRILKISEAILANPVEFAKAKFAETMMARNVMFFYMDVFGREERFDRQHLNDAKSYSYKIPTDFEAAYISAVREGYGFNPMDSLAKIFVAKGLNETHPNLYNKILKYRNILQEADLQQAAKNSSKGLWLGVGALMAIGAGIFGYVKSKQDKHQLFKPPVARLYQNQPFNSSLFHDFIEKRTRV